MSFALRRGEVLGIGGLVGAGRTELVRLIYGADRLDGGAMTLDGAPFAPRSPKAAVSAGLGLVPEERRAEGLVLSKSVAFNLQTRQSRRRRSQPLAAADQLPAQGRAEPVDGAKARDQDARASRRRSAG